MDKSFNDQELSDIMKEIEALEDDFKDVGSVQETEVMDELADLDEAVSIPQKPKSPVVPLKVAPQVASASHSPAPTCMSFKVQGDVQIDLQFEIGGRVVSLEVCEQGLSIQMDGGVTFTVPMTPSQKKVG